VWLNPYFWLFQACKDSLTARRTKLDASSYFQVAPHRITSLLILLPTCLGTKHFNSLFENSHSVTMTSENPTLQLDPKYDHYDFPTTAPTKQSGHPGHTTPEQDAQVFQLRTKLEQAGYTERLDTLTLVSN